MKRYQPTLAEMWRGAGEEELCPVRESWRQYWIGIAVKYPFLTNIAMKNAVAETQPPKCTDDQLLAVVCAFEDAKMKGILRRLVWELIGDDVERMFQAAKLKGE